MKNKTTTGTYTLPSKVQAYITKGKQRLKQIGLESSYARTSGTVYLRNGDTFEMELFNGKTNMVMAKIKLNGKYISGAGLVLRPGERVFLERFLDENRKFIFNTYDVANTAESKAAIEDNGDIEIEFFDEYVPFNNIWSSGTITYTNNNGWFNSGTGGNQRGVTTLTSNSSDCTYYIGNEASVNCSNSNLDFVTDMNVQHSKKTIETGRVEKGDITNQEFRSVDNQFNIFPFHTSDWKILPVSQKPIYSEDIRAYCTGCGCKIKKSTFRFCPQCGTKCC